MFEAGDQPLKVAVLGSTGSVGSQALDVVRAWPGRFKVVALSAASDSEALSRQVAEFDVPLAGIVEASADLFPGAEVVTGASSSAEVAARCDAQVVLNAVVGSAGLHATLASLAAGKNLALANKESLVAAGELVMSKAGPGQIRPVDSEHSAMWQLLEGTPPESVRKALLTGSGGPFRGWDPSRIAAATPAEALAHPVWEMGPRITVDSASMMNKGLEVIEAHFLFGFTYDEIEVVIHPEGLVHAMIELSDGSVLAHAAPPDMRLPVQVALGWPDRLPPPGGRRIDWSKAQAMTFEPPDLASFPCLALAFEAGRAGGTFPAALNAADEVAVEAFLSGRIRFGDIPGIIEEVLAAHPGGDATIEGVMEADASARHQAGLAAAARET